ncbi:MAG: hypothetical protein WC707_02245 [Candidatus Babeliaceae bacterium]|jgi:hypothetical protein
MKIRIIILLSPIMINASTLRITNLAKTPIIFDYQSAGKKELKPLEIGSKQARKIRPRPHGINTVSWSYKMQANKNNATTYSVPLEVSPIRTGGRLIIYDDGKYYYSIDKKYMQASSF